MRRQRSQYREGHGHGPWAYMCNWYCTEHIFAYSLQNTLMCINILSIHASIPRKKKHIEINPNKLVVHYLYVFSGVALNILSLWYIYNYIYILVFSIVISGHIYMLCIYIYTPDNTRKCRGDATPLIRDLTSVVMPLWFLEDWPKGHQRHLCWGHLATSGRGCHCGAKLILICVY